MLITWWYIPELWSPTWHGLKTTVQVYSHMHEHAYVTALAWTVKWALYSTEAKLFMWVCTHNSSNSKNRIPAPTKYWKLAAFYSYKLDFPCLTIN
jgi:hypothetical protein